MKYLLLGRHSKSFHEIEGIPDIDRPLNQRGYNDAYIMKEFINAKGIIPDLIISSPAIRAFTTSRIYSELLQSDKDLILNSNLYFNESKFFNFDLSKIPNDYNKLMLIGHNPGIHAFSEKFQNKRILKFPTSGIICLKFNLNNWSDLNNSIGELLYFQFPSNLKS